MKIYGILTICNTEYRKKNRLVLSRAYYIEKMYMAAHEGCFGKRFSLNNNYISMLCIKGTRCQLDFSSDTGIFILCI